MYNVDPNKIKIAPQPGAQETFLSSPADIAIYGGSAGSGKSFALLLEPLHYVTTNRKFYSVIFRRVMPEITNPGSLWDESVELYGQLPGVKPNLTERYWKWAQGGKVLFSHLEQENTKLNWHGAQVPLLCFDELTTFSESQFFYMLSRNRSTCGVRPYVRATCNPDPDSWVKDFISWWIGEDGFPILERGGVLRWFVRVGDKIVWADSPEELKPELINAPTHGRDGKEIMYRPMSVTFVPALIWDNPALLDKDPGYLAKLLAMDPVEQARLLGGNWKIKAAAGLMFRRLWCEIIEPDQLPPNRIRKRGWDLAGTPVTKETPDPDWTYGVLLSKASDGADPFTYVEHAACVREDPGGVETFLKHWAQADGHDVSVCLPQDPGQAGKYQITNLIQRLDGYPVEYSREDGDKEVRFRPFSARAKPPPGREYGFVKIVRGDWNDAWFTMLENFAGKATKGHDDAVDGTSRAFNAFVDSSSGLLEYYQMLAREKRQASEKLKDESYPTEKNGGVYVIAPNVGVNQITDTKGRPIYVDALGRFLVTPEHAKALARSGFKPAV